MRSIIYSALEADITISGLVSARIYEAGSLGVGGNPADPERPYMMIKESAVQTYDNVRKVSPPPALRTYQVFVYDERGDYNGIETILAAVRQTVLGLESAVDSATGTRCIGIKWTGDSGDMVDAQHDSNVKYATFQATSTK